MQQDENFSFDILSSFILSQKLLPATIIVLVAFIVISDANCSQRNADVLCYSVFFVLIFVSNRFVPLLFVCLQHKYFPRVFPFMDSFD